jgi:hypothetical protein
MEIPSSVEILERQIKEKEEMINEKKTLVLEIFNYVKSDKAKLEELKRKRDHLQEKEINQGLEQMFGPQQQSKMTEQEVENLIPEYHYVMTLYPDCKGLNDRIIITVDIKVPRYNSYSLDAQIDTG